MTTDVAGQPSTQAVTQQHVAVTEARHAADAASRLFDMKGVAKPPTFSGKEADWPDFRFKFEATCALLDVDEAMTATLAVTDETQLRLSCLHEAARLKSKMLYALLVQITAGKALSLVRLTERNNGLWAWRKLALTSQTSVLDSAHS